MNKKVLLGIAGAISLVEYRRYSVLMDSISVKPKNLKLSTQGQNLVLDFQLEFINSSQKSIDVERIAGNVFIGDKFLGTFNTTQSDTIKANSTSSLPVKATINAQDILNNLKIQKDSTLGGNITLVTKAIIKFRLLGFLSIPVAIKDTTVVTTSNLIKDVKNIVTQFKSIFSKK